MKNKGAIVTGGGSGINLCLVQSLHAQGYSVLIADLALRHDAEAWLESLSASEKEQIRFQRTDVTVSKQLEEAFDAYAEIFSPVPDVVVAGAGVYEASFAGFWNDQDDQSGSDHYRLLDINLVHPIKLTRIAIRRLQQAGKKEAVVLHLSSITAQKPSVILPLYAVSKAGVSHFVRCMKDLQGLAGIRVVGVAPGVTDTPLFRDHPEALQHVDMDKDFALPASEVVDAMMSLISHADRYPSGTILEVGDLGESGRREVALLNDGGPQGRSTFRRAKAADAVTLVKEALKADAQAIKRTK